MEVSEELRQELTREAAIACDLSHVPYSVGRKNRAGAAILTDKGVFRGAQVENCAFPNSICAAHSAFLNAMSSGATRVDALVVINGAESRTPEPCGCCLQVTKSFGNMKVWALKEGQTAEVDNYSMSEALLPSIFGSKPDIFTEGYQRNLKVPQLKVVGQPPPNTVTQEEYELLCRSCVDACENAVVHVSDFPVGAALLTESGEIILGANIESEHLRLTLCAERCAMVKAVAKGFKRFRALAVCCFKLDDYGRPCGGCRQSLVEFADYAILQCKVNLQAGTIEVECNTALGILPNAFYPGDVASLLT